MKPSSAALCWFLVISALAQNTSATQTARLDESSTATGQSGMFSSNPIVFEKQTGNSVAFKVKQTWKPSGSVNSIFIFFESTTGGVSCQKEDGIVDETSLVQAGCNAGFADVTIFAADDTFTGLTDISKQIPESCGVGIDYEKKTALFTFSIPCNADDQSYVESREPCDDFEGPAVIPTTPTTNTSATKGGGDFRDPHGKTWDGYRYDYHGECDLVLLHSDKFANGAGLDLHVRTQIRHSWSFISNGALRIGEETLELDSTGDYYLNGIKNHPMPATIGGYEITHTLTKKGRVNLDVHLDEQTHIFFREYHDFVSVKIDNGKEEFFGDSVGLMGSFGSGDMLLRDGATLEHDPTTFAQEWQVRPESEGMIFRDVRAPQFPVQCILPSSKRFSFLRRRLTGYYHVSIKEAKEACAKWEAEDEEGCVYSVLVTGNLAMAQAGAF